MLVSEAILVVFSLAQPFRAGNSGGAEWFWGFSPFCFLPITEGLKAQPFCHYSQPPALKGWANEKTFHNYPRNLNRSL